jgi:formylmethanofuran dehydrogenase subunit E
MGKCRMLESVRCDHCEEDFAPEELTVLAPPAGDGELICARCIEIKLRRAIAELSREN